MDPAQPLKDLKPTKDFFVGIDSDGCVFDTMGIKQRECFCPMLIGYFGLQPVAQAARECKDFADLFSKTRGANRHKTAVRIIRDLLPTHPMVRERDFKVPAFRHYCAWVDNPKSLLSNQGLKQAINDAKSDSEKAELQQVLQWSLRVNEMVTEIVKEIPPFPYVRQCLEKITRQADVIVCSATPNEALIREWQEHDIDRYPKIIAGQEMGTKAQHLDYASTGKYTKNHVLMIGDAPGDLKAARSVGALFFPVNPGHEAASWKRFHDEAFDKFIKGQYTGDYEAGLIAEFDACLPENPPWKT
ncbi:MAG: HAD hydrolase-like protein [Sedimentisphaerales bacterium]|nr:HAD hydrolase-like protein [Sedimentisphaerales bacterium]